MCVVHTAIGARLSFCVELGSSVSSCTLSWIRSPDIPLIPTWSQLSAILQLFIYFCLFKYDSFCFYISMFLCTVCIL